MKVESLQGNLVRRGENEYSTFIDNEQQVGKEMILRRHRHDKLQIKENFLKHPLFVSK